MQIYVDIICCYLSFLKKLAWLFKAVERNRTNNIPRFVVNIYAVISKLEMKLYRKKMRIQIILAFTLNIYMQCT